jgi:hypothetical protein
LESRVGPEKVFERQYPNRSRFKLQISKFINPSASAQHSLAPLNLNREQLALHLRLNGTGLALTAQHSARHAFSISEFS